MHGNVAEWTRSAYRPYPCDPSGDEDEAGLKVVRGGSWNDTMAFAGSASRWRYAAWQPVYQVGFRVLVVP
jgi:formylglycine-generating enzyme required for sulfatase activity